MVIVKLYGGLGNQMYQYAAGRVLAERLNTNLKMDLSWFEAIKGNPGVVQRVYELDGFNIPAYELSHLDRIILKFKPPKEFKEGELGFNKIFQDLNGSVILDGYWQSYKYFNGYENYVKNLFVFPESHGNNKEVFAKITSSESVSLHVRRGDYNTSLGRKYHGLMPLGYYKRALKALSPNLKKPTLFVFSDEIDWCKDNIKFDFPTLFVDSNTPNTGSQDMKLMSACKHNIIANSSFSWWAAWLNKNPNKIVCAPKNWFAGEEHRISDRIPKDWLLL